MELFEYWWLESHQDESPESKKDIAKAAWEAAKSLYSEPTSHQVNPADVGGTPVLEGVDYSLDYVDAYTVRLTRRWWQR